MSKKNIADIVNEIQKKVKQFNNNGKVASYIPELSNANPDDFSLCVISNDKKIYKSGNYDTLFTIQSISKVVSLLQALELYGFEGVFRYVGVEPTGDTFNSMIRLETQTHIPFNPMINAGAIEVVGLLNNRISFEEYLSFLRKLCGRDNITVNKKVYLSEKKTGMKNRAIAYLLANDNILQGEVEKILDFYFKMCSIEVNTVDIARIGSVLSNNGMDIFTGERLIKEEYTTIAKTLMFTCGLYDGSGEFAVKVGIPAKSGVGGGIMGSSKNGLGIGVYSPALDSKGNSVCGIKAFEILSSELKLHTFDN